MAPLTVVPAAVAAVAVLGVLAAWPRSRCRPAVVAGVLRSIEQAGQRALASMDRTVHMLHDGDGTQPRCPMPTLTDLPDLAAWFATSAAAMVRLDLDPALVGGRPGGWRVAAVLPLTPGSA